jgi:hypothetical protein
MRSLELGRARRPGLGLGAAKPLMRLKNFGVMNLLYPTKNPVAGVCNLLYRSR